MARLAMTVHITAPDGTTAVLGPNSDLPEWALRTISNPKVWAVAPGSGSEPRQASPAPVAEEPVTVSEPEIVTVGAPTTDSDEPGDDGSDDGETREEAELPVADGYDYTELTVAELRHEIAERNEHRDDADAIPADGLKADLIAALQADDETA